MGPSPFKPQLRDRFRLRDLACAFGDTPAGRHAEARLRRYGVERGLEEPIARHRCARTTGAGAREMNVDVLGRCRDEIHLTAVGANKRREQVTARLQDWF